MKHYVRYVLLAAGLLFSACGTSAPAASPAVQTMQNVTVDSGFDTVITLIEQTNDPDGFQNHFNTMCEQFRYYNDLFDIYEDHALSGLKAINDSAGIRPVKTDPALIELIQKGKYFCERSNGAFDITSGALLDVWHRYRTEGMALNEEGKYGSLPSEEELTEAASHHGFEYVEIDEEAATVYLTDPKMRLDVGGIAKGYATELTARMLEEAGIDHAAINAGGNNRTIGSKTDGTPWNVGIQNPDGQGPLFVVRVEGTGSFVTSGDYERYYVAEDGRRYPHIIDPATRYPADRYRSVTIITEDSGDADCLSTALTVLSLDEGKALLEAYRSDTGNHAEAIWITSGESGITDPHSHTVGTYTVFYTEGLEDKLVFQQ